mmetsp:Transcript_93407/g.150788  ORF Transcript_93407/g.150788 Transcript_93407/m.150788 type:complete len:85 (+) Transcript_93407:91-345(+)
MLLQRVAVYCSVLTKFQITSSPAVSSVCMRARPLCSLDRELARACCSVIRCGAMCCGVWPDVAVRGSTWQYVAVCMRVCLLYGA